MKKIKLKILGLSYSQDPNGAYALILSEENGKRRIPIIIGAVEAQAIAIHLENLKPARPLTHDLFVTVLSTFEIVLTEVLIHSFEEGVFYSELKLKQNKKGYIIDSRTSDAIALALRFNCPIYTTEEVISQTGIFLDIEEMSEDQFVPEDEKPKENKTEPGLNEFSLNELQEMLERAIQNEDYEKASLIRDEIGKRKKK